MSTNLQIRDLRKLYVEIISNEEIIFEGEVENAPPEIKELYFGKMTMETPYKIYL